MEEILTNVSMRDGESSNDPRERSLFRRYKVSRGGNRERRPSQHTSATYRSSRRSLDLGLHPWDHFFRQKCIMLRCWANEVAIAYTRSQAWMCAMSIITLSSCLFYVVGTYLGEHWWVLKVEIIFGCFFVADYVLSLLAAPIPMLYVLSWGGIIDLVSCLQVLGEYQIWMVALSFVRYLRLGKAIRVMRNHRLLQRLLNSDDVTVKATLLVVRVLGLVLMTTAILYGTEQATRMKSFNEPDWQWHDALYFTVVTLTTVGYGDVLPVQTTSRLLMVAVIVFAFTYVPLQVSRLVDAIGSRPKYRKGFAKPVVGSQVHVLLAMADQEEPGEGWSAGGWGNSRGQAGRGDGFDRDFLERCIDEFFHKEHGMDSGFLWIVVMASCPPSTEIQNLLCLPKFMSRVRYFCGSVTDPRDMAAVCAEYADCIFLFPSMRPRGADVRAAEEGVTLAAKALRRYLDRTPTNKHLMSKVEALSETGQPRRTVVTVAEIRSKDQLLGFGIDHVICYDEIKMAMLACGTLCPSFLPFVVNCVNGGGGQGGGQAGRKDTRNNAARRSARAPRHHHDDDNHGRDSPGNSRRGATRSALENEGGEPHDNGSYAGRNTTGRCGGGKGEWLQDYRRGATYTLYSISLSDVPNESSIWGMTFRRAALTVYDDSDCKVLLLAAIQDNNLRSGTEGSYHRHGGPRAGGLARDHVDVEVFPGEDFQFTADCYVLVLAETKRKAEEVIFYLQHDAYTDDIEAPLSPVFSPSPPAAGTLLNSVDASPALGDTTTAATAVVTASTVYSVGAPSSSVLSSALSPATAATVIPTTPSAMANISADLVIPAAVTSASTGGLRGASGGSRFSTPATAGRRFASQASPQGFIDRPNDQQTAINATRTARARGSPDMHGSPGAGMMGTTRVRTSGISNSRSGSRNSLLLDEETKCQLDECRRESRREDGVNWTQALSALKRAKTQLQELDELVAFDSEEVEGEAIRTQGDPLAFFDKVEAAAESVADALRIHSSTVPPYLEGHTILLGGHPRVHHFVIALRRLKPLQAVVVVTENKSTFFDLQERLVEVKCDEPTLNINKVYHVFGRTQDRATMDAARFTQAEAVVLTSNQASDSFVLLESFELEQILSEIPPGQRRPKVLIDLSKDSSIYYCSTMLGGADSNTLTQLDVGQLSQRSEMREQDATPCQTSAEDVRNWPLFAAGHVSTESIMDIFAVQAYFGLHVLAFVETLLEIQPPHLLLQHEASEEQDAQHEHPRHARGTQSMGRHQQAIGAAPTFSTMQSVPCVGNGTMGADDVTLGYENTFTRNLFAASSGRGQYAHLRVSAAFHGRSYGELTHYLIESGAMPLGLYRPADTKGSSLPYTHINPAPDEVLMAWPEIPHGHGSEGRHSGSAGRQSESGIEIEVGEQAWRIGTMRDAEQETVAPTSMVPPPPRVVRGDEVIVLLSKGCKLNGDL